MTVTISIDLERPVLADQLQVARQLAQDLRRAGVPAELAEAPVGDGSKSGQGAPLAELIIQTLLSAGGVGAVVKVITAYLQRQGLRKIIVERDGFRAEITAAGRGEQQKLIELLSRPEPGPDATTPEPTTPEPTTAETKAPEIKASEIKTLGIKAPEIKSPEIKGPEGGV